MCLRLHFCISRKQQQNSGSNRKETFFLQLLSSLVWSRCRVLTSVALQSSVAWGGGLLFPALKVIFAVKTISLHLFSAMHMLTVRDTVHTNTHTRRQNRFRFPCNLINFLELLEQNQSTTTVCCVAVIGQAQCATGGRPPARRRGSGFPAHRNINWMSLSVATSDSWASTRRNSRRSSHQKQKM